MIWQFGKSTKPHLQLLQAQKDLELWSQEILPQASAAVDSARKALEENSVSLLLVLETTRQLLTAQQSEREADAQLRRAIAELERSVGRRLFDIETNQPTENEPTDVEVLPVPQVELRADTP